MKKGKQKVIQWMTFDLVEHRGFEPLTPTLPVLCAPSCANAPKTLKLYYSIIELSSIF